MAKRAKVINERKIARSIAKTTIRVLCWDDDAENNVEYELTFVGLLSENKKAAKRAVCARINTAFPDKNLTVLKWDVTNITAHKYTMELSTFIENATDEGEISYDAESAEDEESAEGAEDEGGENNGE